MNKNMEYLKKERNMSKIIRSEIFFAPLLIMIPFLVGSVFIYEWYSRGFVLGVSSFDFEVVLGLILIFGNIMFDIPFIISLRKLSKKNLEKKK